MTLARQRTDLLADDLFIPTDNDRVSIQVPKWVECEQPDELDNEFFNLILKTKNKVYRVPSIDFEFKEA